MRKYKIITTNDLWDAYKQQVRPKDQIISFLKAQKEALERQERDCQDSYWGPSGKLDL